MYEFFLRTFVGSVASQLIPQLHLTATSFALMGSAYYLAYGLMQVPVGILVDKYGVKYIMFFAVLVCVGATFLFSHADNFITATTSRFLMGIGSSFAFVCLLVIAVTWFPQKYFGFFSGMSQFVGTMGPLLAAGPLIMVMAHLHVTWRQALSDIAFFGFLLAILIILFVKNKPRDKKNTLIFLEQKKTLKEHLQRLMKNKQAWSVAFYSGTLYVSIAILGAVWGTAYLEARGYSQSFSADMISFAWLGYAIGCPLLGFISDAIHRRKPILLFSALMGFFVTCSINYISFVHDHWMYIILFFCLGIAASGQNIGFATMSEHVDTRTRATGLGLNNAIITSFGVFMPLIVSVCVGFASHENLTHLTAQDFMLGLSSMPILYLTAFLICLLCIKETYCKPQKELIKLKVRSKNKLLYQQPIEDARVAETS
ncbi:MAG: MFS transporter [Gammaproteobacteria bacterium RIFCSPHIGHO2_12_FULL_38_11]|nr:MAG: MFS transporter [Gammaproteobacteria bacterium RIFCSPHIGHO2_12_FULL_38_11]